MNSELHFTACRRELQFNGGVKMTHSFLFFNFLLDINVQLHLQGQLTLTPVTRAVLLSGCPSQLGGCDAWRRTCRDENFMRC